MDFVSAEKQMKENTYQIKQLTKIFHYNNHSCVVGEQARGNLLRQKSITPLEQALVARIIMENLRFSGVLRFLLIFVNIGDFRRFCRFSSILIVHFDESSQSWRVFLILVSFIDSMPFLLLETHSSHKIDLLSQQTSFPLVILFFFQSVYAS